MSVLSCWIGFLVAPEVYLMFDGISGGYVEKDHSANLRSHSIQATQRAVLSHGTVSTGNCNLLSERRSQIIGLDLEVLLVS